MSTIKFNRVTFTGADDSVRGVELREFVKRCHMPSFIEWGLLVGEGNGGRTRFPSAERLEEFIFDLGGAGSFLSMHVCGKWVAQICEGDWGGLVQKFGMKTLSQFDRVQLNFHGIPHLVNTSSFLAGLKRMDRYFDVILQMDGLNDDLLSLCHREGINVFPLFDLSHGAGVLPASWPAAHPKSYTGYAGGLGPDNIDEQLPLIAAAAGEREFWIDMETRVRTFDDTQFSLPECRRVMEGINRYLQALTATAIH